MELIPSKSMKVGLCKNMKSYVIWEWLEFIFSSLKIGMAFEKTSCVHIRVRSEYLAGSEF